MRGLAGRDGSSGQLKIEFSIQEYPLEGSMVGQHREDKASCLVPVGGTSYVFQMCYIVFTPNANRKTVVLLKGVWVKQSCRN